MIQLREYILDHKMDQLIEGSEKKYMKELKLGKMTSREVAEWMGVSYNSYRKTISKYLDKVIPYAEFEPVYGGIIIKEIYIPIYDKSLNSKDDEKYLAEIKTCQDHLSTLSGMARKFKAYDEDYKGLSEVQIKRRMTVSGNRLFGETKNCFSKGTCGTRDYIWAIKLDNFNHYRLMTPDEEKKFDEIIKSCYSTDAEKIKQAALLEEHFVNSSMTKEEYLIIKEREGLNLFKECLF